MNNLLLEKINNQLLENCCGGTEKTTKQEFKYNKNGQMKEVISREKRSTFKEAFKTFSVRF